MTVVAVWHLMAALTSMPASATAWAEEAMTAGCQGWLWPVGTQLNLTSHQPGNHMGAMAGR